MFVVILLREAHWIIWECYDLKKQKQLPPTGHPLTAVLSTCCSHRFDLHGLLAGALCPQHRTTILPLIFNFVLSSHGVSILPFYYLWWCKLLIFLCPVLSLLSAFLLHFSVSQLFFIFYISFFLFFFNQYGNYIHQGSFCQNRHKITQFWESRVITWESSNTKIKSTPLFLLFMELDSIYLTPLNTNIFMYKNIYKHYFFIIGIISIIYILIHTF